MLVWDERGTKMLGYRDPTALAVSYIEALAEEVPDELVEPRDRDDLAAIGPVQRPALDVD